MHLLTSILAGLLGSVLGAAARVGVDRVERRLRGETAAGSVLVSASPTAGLAAGLAGLALGARRAFWLGAILSAAGADRLDARFFGRLGFDPEALTARMAATVARARAGRRTRATDA